MLACVLARNLEGQVTLADAALVVPDRVRCHLSLRRTRLFHWTRSRKAVVALAPLLRGPTFTACTQGPVAWRLRDPHGELRVRFEGRELLGAFGDCEPGSTWSRAAGRTRSSAARASPRDASAHSTSAAPTALSSRTAAAASRICGCYSTTTAPNGQGAPRPATSSRRRRAPSRGSCSAPRRASSRGEPVLQPQAQGPVQRQSRSRSHVKTFFARRLGQITLHSRARHGRARSYPPGGPMWRSPESTCQKSRQKFTPHPTRRARGG